MDSNELVIDRFYSAFRELDYNAMNACYSDEVVFFDPVFGLLRGEEVHKMWEMLCKNAVDFSLEFGNIAALDHEYYTCTWVVKYTFSKTGRPVINKINAHMLLKDGKILEHSDGFSLHRWSMMAMGFSGWLLGWNKFYQDKIKNTARKSLNRFMQSKGMAELHKDI